MRHRRLGERIEGAPAALAAEPRKPMRASPRDDRSSRAMRTALVRHPLMAARSQSIRTTTSLRAFLHRPAGRGSLRLSHPPKPAIQVRQGDGHFPALPRAQPSNARKPDGKLIGLHRIKLLKPRPSLIHINRYRYKRLRIFGEILRGRFQSQPERAVFIVTVPF